MWPKNSTQKQHIKNGGISRPADHCDPKKFSTFVPDSERKRFPEDFLKSARLLNFCA